MIEIFEKSFFDWCIENSRENWLELWDYKLNGCSPKEVGSGSNKKYYFKCPKGTHESELKRPNDLIRKGKKLICNKCNSFGQFLLDEFGENALELYWDYEKNKTNPFEISKGSNKKIWLICQEKSYHESYETSCKIFYNGCRCPYCGGSSKTHPKDSFGQYLVDTYGKDALELYWDYELNEINPFEIAKHSGRKVWIKCLEKEYHGSYNINCDNFYKGNRCPFCCNRHGKVHPKDSFAQYHLDNTDINFIEKYWSDKNTKNPFELAPCHTGKVWIKCQNDEEHGDYRTSCDRFTSNHRCPKCKESKGERKISKWLEDKKIEYIREKTFPNLLGVGNELLRYDFYISDYNLLIEYQGGFHDGTARYSNETQEEYEERFKRQQEHDKRKREYAELHNIKLLEIWYWDFDNIETILNKNIK